MKKIMALVVVMAFLAISFPVAATDSPKEKESTESYKGIGDKNDPPPPVDLSGKKEPLTVDPKDLKKSDPEPPSLKINPPPPLK